MASVTYSTASGRLLPRTSWRVRSLFYDRISWVMSTAENLDGSGRDVRQLSWDLFGGNKEKWNLRAVSVPQENRTGYIPNTSLGRRFKPLRNVTSPLVAQSVVWQVYGLFRSEFYRKCDLTPCRLLKCTGNRRFQKSHRLRNPATRTFMFAF
jgi:hypothetical protein